MIDLKNTIHKDYYYDSLGITLISYVNLSDIDRLTILEIRNHELVRFQMKDHVLITKENHLTFLNKLSVTNNGHWLVKKADIIIGAINLTHYKDEDSSFIGGNFISPELIGSGVGLLINFLLHKIAFEEIGVKKIKAYIKKGNKNAIRINQIFGSKIIKDNLDYDNYLNIEFSKEDWFLKHKKSVNKLLKYIN